MIPIALPQLRWPYWVLIGLAVGALLGGIGVLIGPAYLDSTARTLSQPQFERAITATPAASFSVSDLVIHPPDASGVYWVTGRYRERGPREITADFKFRAPTPYEPRLAISSHNPSSLTVSEYLDEISRRVPQANSSYRYAWYETPRATMLIWVCAGLIVIGCLWPVAQRLTAGDQMNAGPIESLPEETVAVDMPEPTRQLDTAPLEPAPDIPEDEKQYRGEFYPTQVHAKH
jgi:hypothetical protein